jgi:predicted nucleotidyltransferase
VPEKPLRALVEVHRQEIRALVARHGGRSASVFGSVARGDERSGSDIDFLVELEPGVRPFEILAIGAELEDLLGVKVDVCRLSDLRGKSRVQVLAEAVPL